MSGTDVKPHLDPDEIQVAEVTELLDDGPQECETNAPDPESCPATGCSESSTSVSMLTSLSQRDVITILSEIGQPAVARPQSSSRLYAKKSAMKKLMKIYTMKQLRPLKPTKMCKQFLYFRAPFRSPAISFDKVKVRHMKLTKNHQTRQKDPEEDMSALPICFDDYLAQVNVLYPMLLASESGPENKSDIDLDVTDIRRYKSQLLSGINSQIFAAITSTKMNAEDIPCTISPHENDQFEIQTERETVIRVGYKVCVKISGEDFFGDVVSFLRHERKTFLRVTLALVAKPDQDTDCLIRPVAPVGHLMLQAKAVLSLEKFPLHTEFLEPVMKSLSSGIGIDFSNSFLKFYKKTTDFYTDSVQKVVDTLALNQADVSHICVVDDYDPGNLSEFFFDSVRQVLKNESQILDQLRAITEIQSDEGTTNNDDLKSLKLVIVSKSKKTLNAVMKDLADNKISFYNNEMMSSEIVEFLSKNNDPEVTRIRNLIADTLFPGIERELAKKSGRKLILQSCPIVIGTITDLLNDEFIRNMLANKSRIFDAAIVHEATSFSETELLSLLLFGINKLICFTVPSKERNNGQTIADRMMRKTTETNVVDSKSPVLERSVYKQREEQQEREKWKHAHSFRQADPVRICTDVRTREVHESQTQRVHPHAGGRGFIHTSRGRGFGAGRGRGAMPYPSLHKPDRGGGSQRNNNNRL